MPHTCGIRIPDDLNVLIDESRGVAPGNVPLERQGWLFDAARVRLLYEGHVDPDDRDDLGDQWDGALALYDQIEESGSIGWDPRERRKADA